MAPLPQAAVTVYANKMDQQFVTFRVCALYDNAGGLIDATLITAQIPSYGNMQSRVIHCEGKDISPPNQSKDVMFDIYVIAGLTVGALVPLPRPAIKSSRRFPCCVENRVADSENGKIVSEDFCTSIIPNFNALLPVALVIHAVKLDSNLYSYEYFTSYDEKGEKRQNLKPVTAIVPIRNGLPTVVKVPTNVGGPGRPFFFLLVGDEQQNSGSSAQNASSKNITSMVISAMYAVAAAREMYIAAYDAAASTGDESAAAVLEVASSSINAALKSTHDAVESLHSHIFVISDLTPPNGQNARVFSSGVSGPAGAVGSRAGAIDFLKSFIQMLKDAADDVALEGCWAQRVVASAKDIIKSISHAGKIFSRNAVLMGDTDKHEVCLDNATKKLAGAVKLAADDVVEALKTDVQKIRDEAQREIESAQDGASVLGQVTRVISEVEKVAEKKLMSFASDLLPSSFAEHSAELTAMGNLKIVVEVAVLSLKKTLLAMAKTSLKDIKEKNASFLMTLEKAVTNNYSRKVEGSTNAEEPLDSAAAVEVLRIAGRKAIDSITSVKVALDLHNYITFTSSITQATALAAIESAVTAFRLTSASCSDDSYLSRSAAAVAFPEVTGILKVVTNAAKTISDQYAAGECFSVASSLTSLVKSKDLWTVSSEKALIALSVGCKQKDATVLRILRFIACMAQWREFFESLAVDSFTSFELAIKLAENNITLLMSSFLSDGDLSAVGIECEYRRLILFGDAAVMFERESRGNAAERVLKRDIANFIADVAEAEPNDFDACAFKVGEGEALVLRCIQANNHALPLIPSCIIFTLEDAVARIKSKKENFVSVQSFRAALLTFWFAVVTIAALPMQLTDIWLGMKQFADDAFSLRGSEFIAGQMIPCLTVCFLAALVFFFHRHTMNVFQSNTIWIQEHKGSLKLLLFFAVVGVFFSGLLF